MKDSKKQFLMCALAILILVSSVSLKTQAALEPQTFYYGIEINGVLCGYSEINLSPMVKDGKDMTLLKQNVFAPATGKFNYHDSEIKQGQVQLNSVINIEGNTASFTSTPGNRETTIELSPDVIFENTLFFPHLKRDFVERRMDKAAYEIYEVRENEVQKSTYTRVGNEKLELAGKNYNTIVLDKLNNKTGLKVTMWLDVENGYLLKTIVSNNRMSYLADPSVVNRIKMADG